MGRLGQIGRAGVRFGAYLVNDTFITDRSAGAIDGTVAEPGPGRRMVVDDNNVSSISGGKAIFVPGGVTGNNPRWNWTYVPRAVGRLVTSQFIATANGLEIGFDENAGGGASDANRQNGTLLQVRTTGATIVAVGTVALSTTYQFAVVLRGAGAYHFVKGGAFSNWTLVWINESGDYTTAYPHMSVTGSTAAAAEADYIYVPAARWLPVPLLSDGFSNWGSSDGLGHIEGINGGMGAGGGNGAYTTVGTWGASGGLAQASALTGGYAIAYRSLATADVIASVQVTRSGGDAGLLLRYTDANNHVTCHHNGTNVVLLKKVAGVSTTVQSTAVTYVTGARLRVVAEGSKFRVFYNGAAVGSEQTISDTALQSPTNVGLYTTNTGNSFDDLVVYARGTGGEYAALDAF